MSRVVLDIAVMTQDFCDLQSPMSAIALTHSAVLSEGATTARPSSRKSFRGLQKMPLPEDVACEGTRSKP
eukprot:5780004-Pyramimonas_sp.AAC.1